LEFLRGSGSGTSGMRTEIKTNRVIIGWAVTAIRKKCEKLIMSFSMKYEGNASRTMRIWHFGMSHTHAWHVARPLHSFTFSFLRCLQRSLKHACTTRNLQICESVAWESANRSGLRALRRRIDVNNADKTTQISNLRNLCLVMCRVINDPKIRWVKFML
jgi:hypothetical protein